MWPDGGLTPFRSEKNTNWDGGYRVHFDGYHLLPEWTDRHGGGDAWPRREFFYWNDDGQLVAMRYDC